MAQQRITVDTLLSRGPAFLVGLVLVATGGGSATVTFYDGVSASDRLITSISTVVSSSYVATFPLPILCERGLFIDIGSNVSGLLVFYEPVRDERLTARQEAP